jgi:hypothetical protein
MDISSSNSVDLGAPRQPGCPASVDADGWMPTPSLRRPSEPLSNRTKILIVGVLAALPGSYFAFGWPHRPIDVAVAPPVAINIPPGEPLPLQETDAAAIAPAGHATGDPIETERRTARTNDEKPFNFKPAERAVAATTSQILPENPTLPESAKTFAAGGYNHRCLPSASAVRRNYPDAQPSWTLRAPGHEGARCWYAVARTTDPSVRAASSPPAGRADAEQADSGADTRMLQPSPEQGKRLAAASGYDPTCLPSASAVRQSYPEARPSWTMRAPGHEGTRCWYAVTRTAADDHEPTEQPGVSLTEKPGAPASSDWHR